MKLRTLIEHILFQVNSISRACYMLTEEQLENISIQLAIIDNNI